MIDDVMTEQEAERFRELGLWLCEGAFEHREALVMAQREIEDEIAAEAQRGE